MSQLIWLLKPRDIYALKIFPNNLLLLEVGGASYIVGLSNKGNPGWTGKSTSVLEVPLCKLRLSIIYSDPHHVTGSSKVPEISSGHVFWLMVTDGNYVYMTKIQEKIQF